jgi:hypothetical protein
MKRKTILILTLLFLIFTKPLCADIADVFDFNNRSSSLQIESGVLYGTAYQIVYENSNSENYEKELQWNMKPLWFVGIFYESAPKNPLANNAVFFNFDFKLGMPSKTGVMEERRWTNPDAVSYFYSHENESAEAFIVNTVGGLSIPLAGNFLAKVSLDFMIIYNKFEVRDSTQPLISGDLSADYYQLWGAINPVFGIEWHGNKFIFKSAFSVNTVILGTTYDRHFSEYMTNDLAKGFLFEAKSSFFYNISDYFRVGISLAYMSIDTRGDLTRKYYIFPPNEDIPNGGGAGYKVFTGELTLGIVF